MNSSLLIGLALGAGVTYYVLKIHKGGCSCAGAEHEEGDATDDEDDVSLADEVGAKASSLVDRATLFVRDALGGTIATAPAPTKSTTTVAAPATTWMAGRACQNCGGSGAYA